MEKVLMGFLLTRAATAQTRLESRPPESRNLYEQKGTEMFRDLDAEFAMILFDGKSLVAARDPIGIRPLYYGYDEDGQIIFASEPKNLVGLCAKIMPFPPGHYYKDGKFVCYRDMSTPAYHCTDDLETACCRIREKLTAGIEKRLEPDDE